MTQEILSFAYIKSTVRHLKCNNSMPKDTQPHRKRTTNQNGEYLWGESAVGGVSCACLKRGVVFIDCFRTIPWCIPSFSATVFAHKFCCRHHCNTTTLCLSFSLVACYHPYHLHCQHTKSPTGIHQVVETAVDRREIVSYPRSTTTTHTTIVLVETHSSSNPNQRRRRPDTKTILLGRAENVTYCQTSAVRCRSLVKTAKST